MPFHIVKRSGIYLSNRAKNGKAPCSFRCSKVFLYLVYQSISTMSETPAGRDASNETLNDHSKDPAWVITREEYELDANGKAVRKSFSMERRQEAAKGMSRKDRIDMYIRVTGMAAIFIPLLLFYLQSCNEKQKQQVAAKKEEKKSIYEMQQQITSQV